MSQSSEPKKIGGLWFWWLFGGAWLGVMFASVGFLIYEPLGKIGASFVCQEPITVTKKHYSYKPGQSGVQYRDYCADANGRREVTWDLVRWNFLIYVPSGVALGFLAYGVSLIRKPARE
jgi:hypothetical protein